MLLVDLPAFAAAAGWPRLPVDVAVSVFEATATDPTFPGALLPRMRPDGSVVWYAAAPTAQAWRRLRPLLLSYAGPTVTTFSGLPAILDGSDPAELILMQAGVFSAALLVPPNRGTALAARALARLVAAIARAPGDVPRPSPSTGALLANLDMCLAAGDRAGADRCLTVLREEWRLDVVNLRFVEVRIASAFREWPQLASQPWFDDLCLVSKPAFIAQELIEALWQTRLLPFADDPADLRRRYLGEVRPIYLDLLAELPQGINGASEAIAELEAEIAGAAPSSRAANSEQEEHAAKGWLAWVTAVAGGDIRDAAAAARKAAMEQPASSVSAEEAETVAVQLQILALRDDSRTALRAALPELVQWLADDTGYPRSAMRPFYEAALTIFTLLEERGRAARDVLLEVFDTLLSLEPSPPDYRRHLQDAAVLVSGEAGTSTAYWLIALAESLLRNPSSDGPARLALLNEILASLQPISGLLTAAQRAAYSRVAIVANWPPLAEATAPPSPPGTPSGLAGKLLGLYTLTESAGRQASDALSEAFPGVRVEVSSDYVCTPRLRALARDADLFVLATASAKHAATDCIQRHRSPDSLIAYAAGRGATSILRAVEESLADKFQAPTPMVPSR